MRDLSNQKSVDTPYLSTLFSETKSEHQQLKKYRKERGANRSTIAVESFRIQKILDFWIVFYVVHFLWKHPIGATFLIVRIF